MILGTLYAVAVLIGVVLLTVMLLHPFEQKHFTRRRNGRTEEVIPKD